MNEAVTEERVRFGGGSLKLVVLLAAAVLFVSLRPLLPAAGHWTDAHALARQLRGSGMGGEGGMLMMASFLIFLGFPRLVFFALGGVLFGFAEGFGVAMAASLAGSFACFWLLRWCGRSWLAERFGKRRLVGWITRNEPGFASVFMARQLPVGNLFINAGLAMSRVGSPAFLLGSMLGFIPQGAAAALIGSGTSKASVPEISMRMSLAVVILIASGLWTWRMNSKRNVEAPEVAR